MTVRHWNDAQVEAAIAAAVARERERCAWLCDQLGLRLTEWELTNVALNCANAIRRALPDGGATTAEPQPDEAHPVALAATELLAHLDRFGWACLSDSSRGGYTKFAGTVGLERLYELKNALRASLSASSVGGATTEGTTP